MVRNAVALCCSRNDFHVLERFPVSQSEWLKRVEDAKAAQVEVFNGQDTRDGVNILILGTDGRMDRIVQKHGQILLWF